MSGLQFKEIDHLLSWTVLKFSVNNEFNSLFTENFKNDNFYPNLNNFILIQNIRKLKCSGFIHISCIWVKIFDTSLITDQCYEYLI